MEAGAAAGVVGEGGGQDSAADSGPARHHRGAVDGSAHLNRLRLADDSAGGGFGDSSCASGGGVSDFSALRFHAGGGHDDGNSAGAGDRDRDPAVDEGSDLGVVYGDGIFADGSPGGIFLCALWGAMVLSRRRLGPAIVLGWGTMAWFIACWIFWGNPDYFFREGWSWPADSLRIYGHGTFFAYVDRWGLYCGPVLLGLFLAGVYRKSLPFGSRLNGVMLVGLGLLVVELIAPGPIRENILPWVGLALAAVVAWEVRRWRFAVGVWVFLLIFTLHSVLWWRGWFASCGLMRIMACVAPITAVVCLYGWNLVGPRIGAWGRGLVLGAIVLTAMGYYVVEPRHQRIFHFSGPATSRRGTIFWRRRR